MGNWYKREKDVIAEFRGVMEALEANGEFTWKHMKTHGNVFVSGEPDVVGVLTTKDGETVCFAFEFKSPNAPLQPSERQAESLADWAAAGAVSGVVNSARMCLKLLGLEPEADVYLRDYERQEDKYLNRRRERGNGKRDCEKTTKPF